MRTLIPVCLLCAAIGCGDSFVPPTTSVTPDMTITNPDMGTITPQPDMPATPETDMGGPLDGLIPIVYAHSDTTLYSLDPNTRAIESVGNFDGCTRIIDIAIDKNQNIYAATSNGLFAVDPRFLQCTLIADGRFPNSLSFVPVGTIFENAEALVGYNGSDYVQISLIDGEQQVIGSLGEGFRSSGDIVSVQGGKTFLTVSGPGCEETDCLFEVDPVTGDRVKNWGSVEHDAVYGLAFWSGRVYGFSDSGDFFEIGFEGENLRITPLMFPGAPEDLRFWGAGSTTIAPIFE